MPVALRGTKMSAMVLSFSSKAVLARDEYRFTIQDRMGLTLSHGHDAISRIVIDDGDVSAGASGAAFALIYTDGAAWARYAVTRSGAQVITWCCQTGADLTITASTKAALEALAVSGRLSQRCTGNSWSRRA